jgi:lauroyl/myristoyl acyltransferase
MAAREQSRLVVFHAWTEATTGRVQLHIRDLGALANEQAGATALAAHLDALVQESPHHWHQWYLLNSGQ